MTILSVQIIYFGILILIIGIIFGFWAAMAKLFKQKSSSLSKIASYCFIAGSLLILISFTIIV
jgi:hypothetical protein